MAVAPTGVAASQHRAGDTYHHMLSLGHTDQPSSLYPLSIQQHAQLKANLEDVAVLVIDEISMVGAKSLAYISKRLQQAFDNDLPFGGLAVLLVGDFYQVPPVGAAPLYDDAINYIAHGEGNGDTARMDGALLFSRFTVSQLSRQERAAADLQHTSLIDRLRDVHSTAPPFTRNDFANYKKLSPNDIVADATWAFAPIVVTSNHERQLHNASQAVRFARCKGLPVLRWRLPFLSCGAPSRELDAAYATDTRLHGYFVEGAPAILLDNIFVHRGLANGTHVVMHSVTFSDSTPQEQQTIQDIRSRIARAQPGEIVDLPVRPYSVNVSANVTTFGSPNASKLNCTRACTTSQHFICASLLSCSQSIN